MKAYSIFILATIMLFSCTEKPKTDTINSSAPCQQDGRTLKRTIAAGPDHQIGDTCFGGMTLFDEKGRKTESFDYSECGVLFKKVYFEYEGERIVRSKIRSALENVDYNWHYNEAGQLVEQIATAPTTSFQYKLSFEYDSLGQQVKYTGTMADGAYFPGTCIKEYKYENGRKTWTYCYNGEDRSNLYYRLWQGYDEEGRESNGRIYRDPNSEEYSETHLYYEYY